MSLLVHSPGGRRPSFGPARLRSSAALGLIPALAIGLALLTGCNDRGGSTQSRVAITADAEKSAREEMGNRLLDSASDMLNDLDSFDDGTLENALQQVVRRMNEGLATLPDDVERPAPLTIQDGHILREIVWLRDAARFAVGDATDPLVRAERLLDWTARNIQLIPPGDPDAELPLLPWHILMFGRANELDRAWLFQLLARQQQLDVVLLAYPAAAADAAPAAAAETRPGKLKRFCAGLLLDKQLYLFDARIGAPIRTSNGQVATLAQVTADDGPLRALDLAAKPYPAKAADLGKLVAVVEASKAYTEPRFARIGRQLHGANKLVLEVDPAELSTRLKQVPGIVEVVEWPLRDERFAASRPVNQQTYAALQELLRPFSLPPNDPNAAKIRLMQKARVRHFSGKYYENPRETDPELKNLSINRRYQATRTSKEELISARVQFNPSVWTLALRVKQNATYWLGLVAYDLGNYDTARSYFDAILAEESSTDWVVGARYNRGRSYEAEADALNEALKNATKDAPQEAAQITAQQQALRRQALETYRKTYLNHEPDDQALLRAKQLEATLKPQ